MTYKGKLPQEKMIELYNMGFSPEEIAKQYGYRSTEYILCKLRQAGVFQAKNIDKGKVFALHKAGWSVSKIAQEMVTSVDSIEGVLNDRV